MAETQIVEIWPVATGILDLPEDWPRLEVPEMRRVEAEWKQRREEALGSPELETFTQQLHREWAIETGIIENLYDIERGVTVSLIEQGFSAAIMEHGSVNKDPEGILALLNDQKDALEGLFDFVAQRRPLSAGYIKEQHAAMTRSQASVKARDIHGNELDVPMLHGEWKTLPNYPVRDGHVFQYCPPEHTAAEMDRLIAMHLAHEGVPPEVESAWLHHRFTQIHPFQDGNGRIARALAPFVLIRAGLFPLTIPRDEKPIYIQALERADAGNLRSLALAFGRSQEVALRRASGILARMAPPSRSAQEAAERLASTLAAHEGPSPAQIAEMMKRVREARDFARGGGRLCLGQDSAEAPRI